MLSPLLFVISLDGFWYQYLNSSEYVAFLPTFSTLKGHARALRVKPTMVTKTLPNHVAMVTGLYQESSGQVGNNIYYPSIDEVVSFRNFSDSADVKLFYGDHATPIWYLNDVAGGKSLEYKFPTGCAPFRNRAPSYCEEYSYPMPAFSQTMNEILNKLAQQPDINYVISYHPIMDSVGHKFGPSNKAEVIKGLQEVDEGLQTVIRTLTGTNKRSFNIMVISDHGFMDVKNDVQIPSELVEMCGENNPSATCVLVNDIENLHIFKRQSLHKNNSDDLNSIHQMLTTHFSNQSLVRVYWKSEIPQEFHYRKSNRIGDIVVMAQPGVILSENSNKKDASGGAHGWNNSIDEMQTIFLGYGADFATDQTVAMMENVDHFALQCKLLRLKCDPSAVNASFERIIPLLANASDNFEPTTTLNPLEAFANKTGTLTLVAVGISCLILTLVSICYCVKKHPAGEDDGNTSLSSLRRYEHHQLLKQHDEDEDVML